MTKNAIKKTVSILLAVLILLGSVSVSALNFNGTTSSSGDGSSATASTGGYAVPNMLVNNSNRAVGYRFTVCNSQGTVAYSPVDMFREATWSADGIFYAGYYKFDSKRSKTELKSIYTYSAFSTSGTTAACCHDSNIGLTLPNDTTGLEGWCTDYNIGVVLRGLWGISVATLEQNAWAVLIEPIFPVKIQGTYHSLTPTEIAVYGASKFGAGSRGNSCSNSNSWGFIAYYTNRHLPNALRLASSYMGMSAAGYASSCLTFSEIINNGYGAAIVYGNYLTLPPKIVRWTYYQPSWQGFYVYVYTERVTSLSIPTWTEANGQDELIWYPAIRQDNNIRGQYYNWVYFVPLSEHNNEKGNYITHFYAYHANGTCVTAGSSYEPPKVPQTKILQTDNNGFYVYANIQSANRLSIPVWTDLNWQDELIWYPATAETNLIDGVTYHWKLYVPFSDHNNEKGLYYIDYYAANDFSEGLYGASDTYIPKEDMPKLIVDYCDAYKGSITSKREIMGTSHGPESEKYEIKNGYLEMNDTYSLRVRFTPDSKKSYPVKQTVWIGDYKKSRSVSSDDEYFDVEFPQVIIDENTDHLTVKAKVDIYEDNTFSKMIYEGIEYSFYIPIKPTVKAESVTVIDILGQTYAKVNKDGATGTLYYGQRINSLYKFAGYNGWNANEDLTAGPLEWQNGEPYNASIAFNGESTDLAVMNYIMSKSRPYEGLGSMSYYTVNFNSTPTVSGKMTYEFVSKWSGHYDYATTNTTMNIPVVKADVQLKDILLIDKDGFIVAPDSLTIDQTVTVVYVYYNNTKCPVYVNGYGTKQNKIGDIYRIEPNSEIYVTGDTFTVNDLNDISIWGGVYLEGSEIFDTHYESNGKNNEKTIVCHIVPPLEIVGLDANASYRENTDVVSSFWIVNDSKKDYFPSDVIKIAFSMYVGSKKVFSAETKDAVVPANDHNLYYIKWKVPDESAGKTARIVATLYAKGKEISSDEIINSISKYDIYKTPDTEYEKKAPDGFRIYNAPGKRTGYATWWQYEYDKSKGQIVKNYYGCGLNGDTRDTVNAETDPINKYDTANKKIKSGYGFSLNAKNIYSAVTGTKLPDASAFTNTQYATALFPEFYYAFAKDKCRTLKVSDELNFMNDEYDNMHFIPIYYPDGEYTVSVERSDFWTPSGMITARNISETFTVEGNAYDDHYIGRR